MVHLVYYVSSELSQFYYDACDIVMRYDMTYPVYQTNHTYLIYSLFQSIGI